MSIVLARIDNRLIHGQVLESWVPHVHADCLLVANDGVAGNPMRKILMAAAVPKGLGVFIETLAGAADLFAGGRLIDRKVLLLVATSEDALALYRLGVAYDKLNLGNLHGGENRRRVSCTIAFAPEDFINLGHLEAAGVQVVAQCIPADRERDWKKLSPQREG
ncbi:PTS system mannose/fructose/N-acetylgalactosamine-transporter subunit IIB [Trichloromonas sp.]|uniref:PTS system mannose/fructose/N-acetylgalactosamine-transporter subunit IIB n=1 Tax=Trichloromonas sp. TaxID=3069249 RepID=UPI002A433793|nr:PTS sugar transporter subunit IIB [Trichloromonas sp.]